MKAMVAFLQKNFIKKLSDLYLVDLSEAF